MLNGLGTPSEQGILGAYSGSWIPVALASDVGSRPLRLIVLATPIVLCKDGDEYFALLDRCPHRGARLSDGTSLPDGLRCPYHGWVFSRDGQCKHIPAPEEGEDCAEISIQSFACQVRLGIVWISLRAASENQLARLTPATPLLRYSFTDTVHANVIDVAENLLDITHFPFVHGETFSTPDLVTTLESLEYLDTDFGFECRYSIPIAAKGAFASLVGGAASRVHVRSLFVSPLTQLFYVEYDSGLSYSTVQALCPLGEHETKLLQAGFCVGTSDTVINERLRDADWAIWQEDKAILETLQARRVDSPVRATPTVGVAAGGLRRRLLKAMALHA
jgi:phenylpropionate dioxygenase-like ring-hydroxylating dioxygenase large terminal subunit